MAQKLMREAAAIERDRGSTPPACVVEAANVVMKYLGAIDTKTAEDVLR